MKSRKQKRKEAADRLERYIQTHKGDFSAEWLKSRENHLSYLRSISERN